MFERPWRYIFLVSALIGAGAIFDTQATTPARSGADVYRDFCAVCHGGGWQGAPVSNDPAEWEARVKAGADALLKNAKDGLNGMPPMGTCMDCTDEELERAIAEMLPQAGD